MAHSRENGSELPSGYLSVHVGHTWLDDTAVADDRKFHDGLSIDTTAMTLSQQGRFARGRDLFLNETFDGNGRTCATCHLHDNALDNFDLSPQDVQDAFADDPTSPLFRSIDSDDGASNNYSILLRDATVRIPFTLPPNMTVDELNSPNVTVNSDGTITVVVRRSTPTIENILFEDQIMWDGRLGDDLPIVTTEAVETHNEPGRLPTSSEESDIAFFQEQFFSNGPLRAFAKGGPPPKLPKGRSDSERRGRTFFVESGPVIDADNRGLCATCHAGPLLNTTGPGNPVALPGERLTNNFVSETNMLFGNQYPELTYRATLTYDVLMPEGLPFIPIPPGTPVIPAGTEITLQSSDPGRLLETGDPCEIAAACILNPGTTVSIFKIPTLWGVADSAPYFHDNSAKNFGQVMDVYQFLFQITADALGNPAFVISQQDREDIIAYMRFAFKRRP